MRRGQSTPELTAENIARRRRAIERTATTPARNSPQRTSTRKSNQSNTRSPPPRQTTRSSINRIPSRNTKKNAIIPRRVSKSQTKAITVNKAAPIREPGRKVNFNKYRPKARTLSKDDFKCIFCFQLPKIPNDNSRGIVLCPICNYPAHADEFKEWMERSNLCSRCEGPIPEPFRMNPKVMRVKNYLIVIKHFSIRN